LGGKKEKKTDFIKIRSVEAELSHAVGRSRWTNMTNIPVTLRNFENAPKNRTPYVETPPVSLLPAAEIVSVSLMFAKFGTETVYKLLGGKREFHRQA
jgi:hypothetical protein